MQNIQENVSNDIEREKPPFLYHSSSNRDLEELKPFQKSWRDKSEGPMVFASDDKRFVSCFLTRTSGKLGNPWAQINVYKKTNRPSIYTHIISDEQRFRDLDKGGAIYTVPSKSFFLDTSKGSTEWTSKDNVKPIKKEIYGSGLDAMIENNVLVYFCNKERFDEIMENVEDFDKTSEILKTMISENEKQGYENPILKNY